MKWHDASVEVPIKEKEYLVIFKWDNRPEMYHSVQMWTGERFYRPGQYLTEVLYWAEIPEPPQGVKLTNSCYY